MGILKWLCDQMESLSGNKIQHDIPPGLGNLFRKYKIDSNSKALIVESQASFQNTNIEDFFGFPPQPLDESGLASSGTSNYTFRTADKFQICNPGQFVSKEKYELIVCNLNAADCLQTLETHLYENLRYALTQTGIIIVLVPSRNTEGIELKEDYYSDIFSKCSHFEFVAFEFENEEFSSNSGWLVLQLAKGSINTSRAFYTDRESKSFSLKSVEKLYEKMLDNDCKFMESVEFAKSIERDKQVGQVLIKHDIHHDLRRTLNFAEMEHSLGIVSVYFAMPEHDLTQGYYDSEYMWETFSRISSMGHEIALHLDLHDLILRYGGLVEGIEAVITRFTENGHNIRSANLHGNTALRKLFGSPKAFIKKLDSDETPLRHVYPICHNDFQKFYASLSLEMLASEYGIRYWIDSEFFDSGVKLETPSNCTDNSGAIRLSFKNKNLLDSSPYSLEPNFCGQVAEHCKGSTTIFLLHPQYYELSQI